MILGMQMYGVLANKGQLSDKEVFEMMKEMGINRIEPCINFDAGYDDSNPSFWSVAKFESLFPVMQEMGFEVLSVFVITESVFKAKESMEAFAKKFAVPYFIINMPEELTKESLQETAFVYRDLSERLAKYGCRPLIHNGKLDTQVEIDGRTAYEYMVDICMGMVGMQFDTGWGAAGGIDPIAFIWRNEARIESLHFKDFVNPTEDASDIYIGGGSVDSAMAMQFGRAKGISLFIDQDSYADLKEDMQKSYDYLIKIAE